MPIAIPKGVTLTQEGQVVRAKGPLGELSFPLQPGLKLRLDGDTAHVDLERTDRMGNSLHGVSRAMVANLVEGVSKGFSKEMEIVGTGYRVSLEGRKLVFKLNYDHPREFPLPEGVNAEVADRPPRVTVRGIDKKLVGQVAADIRRLQPPEPYKGKGVKYANEQIRRKAGKSSG
ncbi:MAG: 50S ribosomal protein L6 [Candidatus Eisenbacteria bacterium]